MSIESKHTPGPWYRVSYGGYYSLQPTPYYDDNNDLLNEDHYVNAEANATLAAAAPDLLEACEILIRYAEYAISIGKQNGDLVNSMSAYNDLNNAKEVIKKAKGL